MALWLKSIALGTYGNLYQKLNATGSSEKNKLMFEKKYLGKQIWRNIFRNIFYSQ